MDILQWNLYLLIIGLVIYAILNAVCVANRSVQHGRPRSESMINGRLKTSRSWFHRRTRRWRFALRCDGGGARSGRRERSGKSGRLKIAAPRGGFGACGKSAATARARHGWGRTGGDHVLSLRHGERLFVPTIDRALDSAVPRTSRAVQRAPFAVQGAAFRERPESRDQET